MRTASWAIIFALVIAIFSCKSRDERLNETVQRCRNIVEENNFWKAMGGADPATIPDTYGGSLGLIAYLMISPLSEFEEGTTAMLRYEAYQAFRNKSTYFLTKTESENITDALIFSKSPGERLEAFQKMLNTDRQASDFLSARLTDQERVDAFLRGEKISPVPEPQVCKCLLNKYGKKA